MCGLNQGFKITCNALDHPKIWGVWDEALKRFKLNKQKTIEWGRIKLKTKLKQRPR